nr:glycosyltransferase family A protein [Elizabethkingia sp. ASV34]
MEKIVDRNLISCICVTRNKLELLKKSIICFNNQTYLNKELIILYEDDDVETLEYLESATFSENILLIKEQFFPKKNLGELRNIAISQSNGDFFCQWDDDDWHHPLRLEIQFSYLTKEVVGCILSRWTVYDYTTQKAYLSNSRAWEGSILCRKEIFDKFKYEDKSVGEDTSFIRQLLNSYPIQIVNRLPFLYFYTYNSKNTWGQAHFEKIFESSLELSVEQSAFISKILIDNIEITQENNDRLISFYEDLYR